MSSLTRNDADRDQLIDRLSHALVETDLRLEQTKEALDEALAVAGERDPVRRADRLERLVRLGEEASAPAKEAVVFARARFFERIEEGVLQAIRQLAENERKAISKGSAPYSREFFLACLTTEVSAALADLQSVRVFLGADPEVHESVNTVISVSPEWARAIQGSPKAHSDAPVTPIRFCAVGGCSRVPRGGLAYCDSHTNPAAELAEKLRSDQ